MPFDHDKIQNSSNEEDSTISGTFPEAAESLTDSYIRHLSAHCRAPSRNIEKATKLFSFRSKYIRKSEFNKNRPSRVYLPFLKLMK
jgi:hypothetical protein